MKNKKGFTLIELLAVVVVLAVVALISIPVILNVIENVKKGAIKNSAYGMLESADVYYAQHIDKLKEPIEFEINNGVQVGTEKLSYTGKVDMGYLMLFKNNDKAVCVDDGKYSASKGVNDKKVTVIEGKCTGEYDEETKSYIVSQTSSGFTSISIKSYSSASQLPGSGNTNDIAIISDTKVTGYYISGVAPTPSEGMVWVVESPRSTYYLESKNVRIGVSYAMQYEEGKWNLKHAYVYNDGWKLLYYVDMLDGEINLENSNLGDIETTKNYEYTGKYQEFTAPFSGYYNVEAWGASGGTVSGVNSGKGAYTKGKIYLNIGTTIYIYVGGTTTNTSGGWNGGGTGTTANSGSGAGGGGSTDIRLINTSSLTAWKEFNSLKSRIMVAAGGSGSSNYDGNAWWHHGGSGGELEGLIPTTGGKYSVEWGGTKATQTSGGFTAVARYQGTNGGFGYGGNGYTGYSSAGGGSGYYGGGGGAHAGGLVSGGSSYISGYTGCNSISEDSKSDNIIHTGSVYHYSNYYFKNSEMVGDNNSGNGKAKITILSIENKTNKELEQEKDNFEYNYTYSGTTINKGNYQEFTVPKNGTYQIQLWGASGGTVSGVNAGKGSYTSGDIYLEKGTKLYVYVGSSPTNTVIGNTLGGYNGGGSGTTASNGSGAGGGGSTDIRFESDTKEWNEFESLKTRIMVAAGGSGGSNYDGNTWWHHGGDGGMLQGIMSTASGSNSKNYTSTVATQTSGGLTHSIYPGTNGGFGYGGNGYTGYSSAGGGSGYYGGAGGAHAGGLVSGGSSYISGYDGCSSINQNSTINNIISNGNKYHYSGYYFTNASMASGMSFGNGKAKITLKNESNNIESMNPTVFNYYYSTIQENVGKYQEFVAPKNGYYKFELWGASGGAVSGVNVGRGAYTSGEIYLDKNTKLYVYVGGTVSTKPNLGGWNGGGTGTTANSGSGAGGGGSTDIRIVVTSGLTLWNTSNSLKSRIMVAAGGSGGSNYDGNTWWHHGGAAGGLLGIMPTASGSNSKNYTGTVATQTSGGLTNSGYPGTNGGFGYGGNGYAGYSSAGAGAGWYGGGGGAHAGGLVSGGSSYISGHAGCVAVTSSGTPKTQIYSSLSDSISYTGYKFINTTMVDGDGYSWTTERGSNGGAPTLDGLSTISGNTGDGYAKITYLGE